MTVWQRWMRQPQRVWLRRALFQIHLWTGLGLGLYVVMLSITGSVLVYRNDLNVVLGSPRPAFEPDRPQLSKEEMTAAVQKVYPGWEITGMSERISRRNPVIGVDVARGAEKKERVFNPYTGEDLGDATTQGELWLLWLVRLHDELLFGRDGQYWNGVLSAVFCVSVLTGLVVWWPGASRWRRSLVMRRGSGWKRFNWDLHSVLGFWLFLFMLMWGISGAYLGVPDPFSDFVDWVSDPESDLGSRPGDVALMWLTTLHFGRWRGYPGEYWLKIVWATVGLVPAMMFITGLIMWWNRVLRRAPARNVEVEAVAYAVAGAGVAAGERDSATA
jgi:uncharacterized iron-regulated membrane protein